MFTIPNQSSVPKAYTQFTDAVDAADSTAYVEAEGGSRLMASGNRERLVDCMEEFVKYTIIMRQHFDLFNDRYSERMERQVKAEKEQAKVAAAAEKEAAVEGNAKTMDSGGVVNGIDVGGI